MGIQGKWEQPPATAESLGTENQVEGDTGQVSPTTPAPGDVSEGEMAATIRAEVERAIASAIGPLRQDLETGIERQVQSFSDKAENRIAESTRQKLETLKVVMEGLKDTLGPDWEAVNRRSRTDILLADAEAPRTTEPVPPKPNAATNGQPAQAQQTPVDGEANAYLADMLGDPKDWEPQEAQVIKAELAQAQDYWAWIRVINKYAALKPQKVGGGPASNGVDEATRAARAQPLFTRGKTPGPSLADLTIALNKAYTEGDNKEIDRINILIDTATGV